MKHKLLFFLAFLWSAWSFGQGFNYNGINYEVTSDVAPLTVSVSNNGNFRGNAVIPGMVSYNGASYNVTSIGDSSFANCSSLTSVTIPYSVTSIGSGSFAYCTSLTSVSIPSSVTSINGFAFVNCSKLASVTIPNSVTLIGEGVFADCSRLKTVTIPDSVASIEDNVFNGCSSLTSVTIPSSVALIGNYAFYNCYNLTKVTIPDSVTSIGYGAFSECSSLISVTIPDSVTSIGEEAFYSCYNLKQITCSIENPLSIDSSVFDGVDLESCKLIVPTGQTQAYKDTEVWSYFTTLTDVAPFVVDGITYEITSVVEPTTVKVIENLENSNASSITIPATVSNNGVVYNVTEISSSAFNGYNNLKQITCGIEEPLVLDESVFDNLDLESCRLIVPTGKVQAYSEAFVWGYFTTIMDTAPFVVNDVAYEIISASTVKVVMNAEGTNVSSITIPTTVSYNGVVYNITEITDSAFKGYNNLKQITCDFEEPLTITEPVISNVNVNFCRLIVPTGKVQVYSDADVWGYFGTITDVAPFIVDGIAYEITSATEPTTVKVIFNLENNYSGSITIPSTVSNAGVVYNVTEISDNAFQYNTDITSVSIGDNVTSIENGTFQGCDMLISANIGDSVTSIGSSAFKDCSSLVSVKISDSITSLEDETFSECSSLVSVTIPDSVTSIGNGVFYGCSSLASVIIPDSVTSIGDGVFAACSNLASVTIPDSVTSIGAGAFYGCSSLASVTIPDSVTSIGEEAFVECDALTSVTVNWETPLVFESVAPSFNLRNLDSITLHVPCGTAANYTEAGWEGFNSISSFAVNFVQPKIQTVLGDQAITFTVTATDVTSYQWELSPDGTHWMPLSDDIPNPDFSGANSNSLTISGNNLRVISGLKFRVVLNAEACSITSEEVTATIPDTTLGTSSFEDINFSYYPNPTEGILNITNSKDIQQVTVFSMLGKLVQETKPNTSNAKVDLSSLATGNYLVQVKANEEIKTIKIVKK